MNNFFAGLFFAAVPALLAGIVFALVSPLLGLLVGIGMFGFGLDLCFRGSGKDGRP